jgi:hypothetical protein
MFLNKKNGIGDKATSQTRNEVKSESRRSITVSSFSSSSGSSGSSSSSSIATSTSSSVSSITSSSITSSSITTSIVNVKSTTTATNKHLSLIRESVTNQKSKKKIPKLINVETITKYEIERIHGYAIDFFNLQEQKIKTLSEEIKTLKEEDISDLNYVDQISHINIIKKKENTVILYTTTKNKDKYIQQIEPILDRFKVLFNHEEEKIFGMENETPEDITKEMINMIDIIKHFTTIEFNFNIKSKPTCACCNYDFTDLMPDSDDILRCPNCSVENDLSHCSDKYLETEKMTTFPYCDYNVENNFIKFLDKFQGKIKCSLNKNVYTRLLDNYFLKKKKDIGSVVKERNFDYKGFKEGTSLDTMLVSLKDIGLSDFYDDVYFICKKYWGWILPDLEENIEKIIFVYEKTQSAYKSIENKKRSSSISIPFHTLKILELAGYKYGVSDFKIPKDEKSKRELEEYWKITCSLCDSPIISYKATKWDS